MLAGGCKNRFEALLDVWSRHLLERIEGEAVRETVERDGLSCNQATARFEIAISTAIDRVNRFGGPGARRPGRSAGTRRHGKPRSGRVAVV